MDAPAWCGLLATWIPSTSHFWLWGALTSWLWGALTSLGEMPQAQHATGTQWHRHIMPQNGADTECDKHRMPQAKHALWCHRHCMQLAQYATGTGCHIQRMTQTHDATGTWWHTIFPFFAMTPPPSHNAPLWCRDQDAGIQSCAETYTPEVAVGAASTRGVSQSAVSKSNTVIKCFDFDNVMLSSEYASLCNFKLSHLDILL